MEHPLIVPPAFSFFAKPETEMAARVARNARSYSMVL
jgi:hypothetical protein